MLFLTLLSACMPNFWEATKYEGNDQIAIGFLCEGRTIGQREIDYWVRAAVRYGEDVEIDPTAFEIGSIGMELVDKTPGETRLVAPGLTSKFITYEFKATVPVGEVGKVGPLSVAWRTKGMADWTSFSAGSCEATVVE